MTTARTVPVTTEMDGDELDVQDAWHLARQHGLRRIAVESFVRFRYGDGFTNSQRPRPPGLPGRGPVPARPHRARRRFGEIATFPAPGNLSVTTQSGIG